jgi:signal transduction histidine kinase
MSPPQTFAAISLLLIAMMVVATSLTQWFYYRQAILDRESKIIRGLVNAVVLEQELEGELDFPDVKRYAERRAQGHFEHSFRALKDLSGIVRIELLDAAGTIAWSDEPRLIGQKITGQETELARAMSGEVRTEFHDADRTSSLDEGLPRVPLIRFFVPVSLISPASAGKTVTGVLALYRLRQDLYDTVEDGLALLWLVTGLGGTVLFVAIYRLFHLLYYRQREAESQFASLSTEHERLVQIEKLSAMGQIVSEIAHQLNNPLVGVVNLSELAEREADNPQRVKELLGEIRKAGDHCRGFVQRMLGFTKIARFEPQLIEMKGLAQETIAFFQQSVGGHPAVALEAPDNDVVLRADPVLIRHALFNLIHNAALAAPEGPVVVSLVSEARKGRKGWAIAVSDSGAGINPAVAAKLFTPFFTTRPGGTGLGLSVAQQIAVQHGGSIHAENKSSGGARFVIWLPAQR